MTSKKTVKRNKTPIKRESFNFGDYVSPVPNPKPIPLGKYRPSPSIEYNISKITKTDSKHKQVTEPEPKPKQNPQQENTKTKHISPPKKHNKLESKSIKQKVAKQQKELQFLQSQLVRLQIENEKMQNGTLEQEISPKKRVRIAFDPAVQIMDDNEENIHSTSIYLTDKISSIRSRKDLTPYKPKFNNTNNTNNNPNIDYSKYAYRHPSSRSDYRITPIPQKRNKRVIFEANLQSIEDKETDKENIENTEIVGSPKDFDNLHSFTTPTSNNKNNNNKNNGNRKAFNLGQKPLSLSADPSFLDSPKDLISNPSDPESSHSTPEYMFSSNSASTVVTPILTPVKGSEYNSGSKPFIFSWNKKK